MVALPSLWRMSMPEPDSLTSLRHQRTPGPWRAWTLVIALCCICSVRVAGAACIGAACTPPVPAECREPASLCATAVNAGVALIDAGHPAAILADAHDFPGVLRAARGLPKYPSHGASMGAGLHGSSPAVSSGALIIVGTLGRDAL